MKIILIKFLLFYKCNQEHWYTYFTNIYKNMYLVIIYYL